MTAVWQALADEIERHQRKALFGLMGDGNYRVVSYLHDDRGIPYYAARHETGAVAMADAYARVSGEVGFCTLTHGPGLTNGLTGLIEAVKASTPLVLLVGDVAERERLHNQGVDQAALIATSGAGHEPFRGTASAAEIVQRAFWRARAEQRPIVVTIPSNRYHETFDGTAPSTALVGVVHATPAPSPDAIAELADLLASAQRPLLLAGRGAAQSGAGPALAALGKRVGALLATTAVGKGLFAGDPFEIGIAGGFATRRGRELIEQADVVVAFGASLNDWTMRHGRLLGTGARLAHVDADAAALGRRTAVSLAVVADARATAEALDVELARRGHAATGARTEELGRELAEGGVADRDEDRSSAERIDPRTALDALERLLPADRIVVIDSGNFQGWPAMRLSVPDPRSFVFSQAFMSLGLGVPGAVGAAIARPGPVVACIVGDGGLLMSLGDLDSAVRYRLPVLVVVMNDAAYGAEVDLLDHVGRPTAIAQFDDVDFAAIARGFGAAAQTIRGVDDLERARDWLAAPDGPLLLDLKQEQAVRPEYWDWD